MSPDSAAARTRPPRILSYGGGLDSFAMLVEAIRRGDRPDVVVFVDVGHPDDPGEWPSTYRHVREVAMPLCAREGIEFVTIDSSSYPVRDARSLFAWLEARHQIPVAGPNRICTRVAKVERFERWAADRFGVGAELEVWIGFESGEEARAAKDPNAGGEGSSAIVRKNRFPLIEWGMCRCRCEAAVRAAGYPVPRKSACVFCPYGSKGDWQTLARELPETFARIAQLEADKPPTAKNGIKLSIMGFRTVKRADGTKTHKAPPLPVFVQGTYKPQPKSCGVCGTAQRATKATGCNYLEA
jgi:hypothetical protein